MHHSIQFVRQAVAIASPHHTHQGPLLPRIARAAPGAGTTTYAGGSGAVASGGGGDYVAVQQAAPEGYIAVPAGGGAGTASGGYFASPQAVSYVGAASEPSA